MACAVFVFRISISPLEKFGIVGATSVESSSAIDSGSVDTESVCSGAIRSPFSYYKKISNQIIGRRGVFCVISPYGSFCPVFRDSLLPRCMRGNSVCFCCHSLRMGTNS